MNIIVTGGTGGLGRAIVDALSGLSARVIFTGRNEEALRQTERELSNSDSEIKGCLCDLTDLAAIDRFVKIAEGHFAGTLDVLVNNAGIALYGPVAGIDAEGFQAVFDTNVRGPMLLTSRLLPMLRRSGQGHVINISSVLGTNGVPDSALYTASKHAMEGFAKVLRLEEGPKIRVTVIQPGAIDTGIKRYAAPGKEPLPSSERLTPAEVAKWVSHAVMDSSNVRADVIRLTPPGQML